jgi:hypothetical protein
MESRNAWRWAATPFAAFAGLIVAYLVLSLLAEVIQPLIPQSTLNAMLRLDLRSGIVGAAIALVTVISGCILAPSQPGLVAIVVFAAGAWLAWQELGGWYFPEGHPRAYQESVLPYVLTIIGGITAVIIVWRVDRLPLDKVLPRAGSAAPWGNHR